MWLEAAWNSVRYCPDICLGGMRKPSLDFRIVGFLEGFIQGNKGICREVSSLYV
jgi:hypothetical protein